jgi:hypothetical protein
VIFRLILLTEAVLASAIAGMINPEIPASETKSKSWLKSA